MVRGEAAPADIVVVSAPLPVSGSLYQASKLIPPAGSCCARAGRVIVAAECPEGTGPLKVVNEDLRAGRAALPARRRDGAARPGMDEATVRQTYATYSPDLGAAPARARELVGKADPSVLVLPDAGDSVPRAG